MIPLALLSIWRGWTNDIEKHKRITKFHFQLAVRKPTVFGVPIHNRIIDDGPFAIFFFSLPLISMAQCSMCKAVAESADGGGFGAGLNYGILYLMIFPYLIIEVLPTVCTERKPTKSTIFEVPLTLP